MLADYKNVNRQGSSPFILSLYTRSPTADHRNVVIWSSFQDVIYGRGVMNEIFTEIIHPLADHRNVLTARRNVEVVRVVLHYQSLFSITKRWSYWVVILILILIKYLAKSFVIIMWHVLSKPMAL